MEAKENVAIGDCGTQGTDPSVARGSLGDPHHRRHQHIPEVEHQHPHHPQTQHLLVPATHPAFLTTSTRFGGTYSEKCRSSPLPKMFSHHEEIRQDSSNSMRPIPCQSDPPHSIPPPPHPPLSLIPKGQPSAMARRNERERKRVRLVNHGFATLRQYLPQGSSRKKLSKMETLRSAIEYIKQLQLLLDQPGSTFDVSGSSASSEDRWTISPCDPRIYGTTHSLSWDDGLGWPNHGSPGSTGSSPHTSLSPEVELMDFSSFS